MRIIQIIQRPQLRGAEVFASQLSQALSINHEVGVIALFRGQALLPYDGEWVYLGLDERRRLTDYSGWKKLAYEIEKFEADVVQANSGDTLKYAVLSKLFFRWRAPIVFRNASVLSKYIKSPLVKVFNAWLFRQVDYVVSVSDESCRDFLQEFPFMKGKIKVVPIGIDLLPLPKYVASPEKYLLHVGGFTFEKNHARLLHIFREIKRQHPELTLLLVGDGPLRVAMEKLTGELGLINSVRFLGFRKEIVSLMQRAQLLVLPSVIEGLPGVILEAMYCKTPVVAYDVGGISTVVKNGHTGWLVPAGDEPSFIQAIHEVLGTDVSRITNEAHELVVREFDNKVMAERFAEAYEEVSGRIKNY